MTTITCTVEAHVATVTVDDEGTRNALTVTAAQRLVEVCRDIARDGGVGAAVIQGANGTFCSGAARDVLANAGQDPAEPGRLAGVEAVYDAFFQVGQLPVPTVAAVRGAAVGAGMNLMLATDLRVVATDARLIAGFSRIGIHPGGGHFALLGRAAGREAAAGIGLFGDEIPGARSQQLGLSWDAVADEDVEARAHELASRIASDPELARRMVRSFRGELDAPGVSWPTALAMEQASQMWSLRRRHETTVA